MQEVDWQGSPLPNCSDFTEITLVLGVGTTMVVTMECQGESDHHNAHLADIGSAFDAAGRGVVVRLSWANLQHGKCPVCHRQTT